MLKNLEMSRYRLDEFLCDLSVSVLERMKGAYLEHGGMFSPKFKYLIVEVLSETEEQVKQNVVFKLIFGIKVGRVGKSCCISIIRTRKT